MTSTIQFAVPAGFVRSMPARTAAFVVLVTASTTLLALPYLGGDQAVEGYAARLETAFELVKEAAVQPSLKDALLVSAKKTDRLPIASGAVVPTVTVEYPLGDSSSALVRLPVQHLASQ